MNKSKRDLLTENTLVARGLVWKSSRDPTNTARVSAAKSRRSKLLAPPSAEIFHVAAIKIEFINAIFITSIFMKIEFYLINHIARRLIIIEINFGPF
jgi:hypothetical protein